MKTTCLAAVAALTLLFVACTPDPGQVSTTTTTAAIPTTTTGPAPFVAGCYDSSIDGMVDIGFNGAINTLDNGAALYSTNGSCTGGAYAYFTLVRAAGHAAQLAACKALNPDFDSVFGFTPGSTTPVIPSDVVYCKRTLL